MSNEHSSIMVKLVLRLTSLEHKIMQGSTHTKLLLGVRERGKESMLLLGICMLSVLLQISSCVGSVRAFLVHEPR